MTFKTNKSFLAIIKVSDGESPQVNLLYGRRISNVFTPIFIFIILAHLEISNLNVEGTVSIHIPKEVDLTSA